MQIVENMFVRCPLIDREYPMDPRDFVMGKVTEVDEFAQTVDVTFLDPYGHRKFYEHVPENGKYPLYMVTHCELYKGSKVMYKRLFDSHVVKCLVRPDDLYEYYIQIDATKEIVKASEKDITASFINGWISPKVQLKNYEFQNPSWYLGRSVVNKANKTLENSIMGFKELAGCKIFLLPHQVNSIMRCVQKVPCRYMLADEVGMGKTIEAASVLKLYLLDHANSNVLIVVPDALKEQWRVELFLKFGMDIGEDALGNNIEIVSVSELTSEETSTEWDFVICDEVHRFLTSKSDYEKLHSISQNAENILLLSATPLQKKTKDYLQLLRLLEPEKYDAKKEKDFAELVGLQSDIINSIVTIIDDIEDLSENAEEIGEDSDPREDEECKELFEDIVSDLEEIYDIIEDDTYKGLVEKIAFDDDDLGLQGMQNAISYICDNYQLERNIIRNRRNILFSDDITDQVRPVRKLHKEISYQAGENEYATYQRIVDIIEENEDRDVETVVNLYQPVLSAFFSSAAAFNEALKVAAPLFKKDKELADSAKKWMLEEQDCAEHITDKIENPDAFDNRIVHVIDYLDQELYEEKVVLFTNFIDTFNVFKEALINSFDEDELCFFSKDMDIDDLELNVYRFQNEKDCRILLCDKTGGEGRNFQNADYIVHLDIPWEANDIEQRIGRLDRLERDPERPDVNSVVIYSGDTFEQQLFKFWNEGLNVFCESLSGLEIILEDINSRLYKAIAEDFRYGLFNVVPDIVEVTKKLKSEIRKEQRFDTIGYFYKPMNRELTRLVRYYNENENELFFKTMMNWASLAGFKPNASGKFMTFNASSFSIKSAENTLLIPPDWTAYVQEKQNVFANRIRELYADYKSKPLDDGNSIRGTFDRKTAISNDYVHFFAPGDDIFDCIIDNATKSTKGQAAAFAVETDIEWMGFIYSFSAEPNEKILLDNGISPIEISYFKNFISSDIVDIPIGNNKYAEIPKSKVLNAYKEALELGYKETHKSIDHFGRRSKKGGFMHIPMRYNISNLEWFKSKYPKESWEEDVDLTYNIARKTALKEIAKKSHLKNAKEEIQRIIAAQISSDKYYKREEVDIEELQNKYDVIFDCLKHPQVKLESACFVWMVKRNDY